MKHKSYIIIVIFVLISIFLSGCEGYFPGTSNSETMNSDVSEIDLTNLEESLAVDVSRFKSADGQPLLLYTDKKDSIRMGKGQSR